LGKKDKLLASLDNCRIALLCFEWHKEIENQCVLLVNNTTEWELIRKIEEKTAAIISYQYQNYIDTKTKEQATLYNTYIDLPFLVSLFYVVVNRACMNVTVIEHKIKRNEGTAQWAKSPKK